MSDHNKFSDLDGTPPPDSISIEDKHYSMVNTTENDESNSKFDKNLHTTSCTEEKKQNGSTTKLSDSEDEGEEPVCSLHSELITEKEHNVDVKYDDSIDQMLPETVTLLTTPNGGKLYLVGTAHFSAESQNDVSMIIQAVQPHIVVVELCRDRISVLHLDEQTIYKDASNLTFKGMLRTLKEYGTYSGLMHILLVKLAAQVARELGRPPGGEFRTAFLEAKKVKNCILHLADRPIGITIQRAVRSLTWWQMIRLCRELLSMKVHISKEDIELCKERSFLDKTIHDLKQLFPAIEEAFVKERDLYLTYSLQVACMPQHTPAGPVPARVVGVVGLGHTAGIMKYWGKVKQSDITPILSVPPPSLSSKIIKFSFKASLLSAVIYIGYRIIPLPSGITLSSIKSSVGGLLKVSVAQ